MSTLTATILAIALSVPAAAQEIAPVPYEVSAALWQPQVGDKIVVDTLNNEGYLMHRDGMFMRFPVATGQRRWVYYIGRSYNATTPTWDWQVKSRHIKGDRVTFGPTGRFLRLYKDGETNTPYGFHEYRKDEEMFGTDEDPFEPAERYESMGCIIVKTQMMDLIEQTWEINNQVLPVKTVYGVENLSEVMLAMEAVNSI